MPFALFVNAEEYMVVDESVEGVKPTVASRLLSFGAYLEKRVASPGPSSTEYLQMGGAQ